jgi:hypothetical protein
VFEKQNHCMVKTQEFDFDLSTEESPAHKGVWPYHETRKATYEVRIRKRVTWYKSAESKTKQSGEEKKRRSSYELELGRAKKVSSEAREHYDKTDRNDN